MKRTKPPFDSDEPQPLLVPAHAYARGLADAAQCVVRISDGKWGRAVGSGWMLTPTLVVVPSYQLVREWTHSADAPNKALLGEVGIGAFDETGLIWQQGVAMRDGAELVCMQDEQARIPRSTAIVLLTLQSPVSIPALRLRSGALHRGEPVSLLSFARGAPLPMLSQGTIQRPSDDGTLREYTLWHDAYSDPGSGGGPMFDQNWQLIGMHLGARSSVDTVKRLRFGSDLNTLLSLLQRSRHWPDIARHYRLVDLRAAHETLDSHSVSVAQPPSAALLRAALQIGFDPQTLTHEQAHALRSQVFDADAPVWTLRPEARRAAISAAGSLEALRHHASAGGDSPGQRMIARILAGPPYPLDDIADADLPWWIQGVHWFADVAPQLPTAADIERLIQRRRLRSALAAIAGDDFLGRDDELNTLHAWLRDAPSQPLYIWGVGGVGKSALIARFAQQLPPSSLLLWLDFDRADIAPDDAPSVIAAIAAQARLQLDGFDFTADAGADWSADAERLAAQLHAHGDGTTMLLVLDSFEVAQHAQRYEELWPLLATLSRQLPALGIVVSGRAPLPDLVLNDRQAAEIPLRGLGAVEATDWLQRHGIASPPVVAEILRLSQGLPLILQLAAQLVEAGGSVEDVPQDLPDRIVAGFLYDRILGRIQDASLKPLAKASLVLRRLTAELLRPVFAGLIELPAGSDESCIQRFAREVALVEGDSVLKLRAEVRTAALELLERSEPELVHAIDRRAADWYAALPELTPQLAAELVYHRLRLGDIDAAQAAWRDGCSTFLRGADENLWQVARDWLRSRLGLAGDDVVYEAAVELDLADSIREARSRGLDRVVVGILAKRKTPRSHGALIFEEAFERRDQGDRAGALALLEQAAQSEADNAANAETLPQMLEAQQLAGVRVTRDRAMLRALLLSELGEVRQSDRILQQWMNPASWQDRPQGRLELAAVCAARIRRNIDLPAEMRLAEALRSGVFVSDRRRRIGWLQRLDVVSPELDDAIQTHVPERHDDHVSLLVSEFDVDESAFLASLERARTSRYAYAKEPAELPALRRHVVAGGEIGASEWPAGLSRLLRRVVECAWRRWTVVAQNAFLRSYLDLRRDVPASPFSRALLAVQTVVATMPGLDLVFETGAAAFEGPGKRQSACTVVANALDTVAQVHWQMQGALVHRILDWASDRDSLGSAKPPGYGVRRAMLDMYLAAEDPLIPLVETVAGRIRD